MARRRGRAAAARARWRGALGPDRRSLPRDAGPRRLPPLQWGPAVTIRGRELPREPAPRGSGARPRLRRGTRRRLGSLRRSPWRDVTRAARAIAGDADGEEIADALLADLFARGEAGSARRPLFDYFHGRSRLGTWLRALVSQRHIDRLRATRRLTTFEDGEAEAWPSADPSPEDQPGRLGGHVERALDDALAALPPRDRLRLAYYHADDLTLAAVGRLLGEHEATVSRKLQKTRDQIKAAIDAVLTTELRLGPDERRAVYEQAIQLGRFDISRLKAAATGPSSPEPSRPAPARKVSSLTRSTERDGTP